MLDHLNKFREAVFENFEDLTQTIIFNFSQISGKLVIGFRNEKIRLIAYHNFQMKSEV